MTVPLETPPTPAAPPVPVTQHDEPWYVRPRIMLPLLSFVVLFAAVLTPVDPDDEDPRLSTYSTNANGAALLHELADRLGWEVSQSREPQHRPDPGVVHAVLAPTVPLRARETRALLQHVRAGGGLFLVINDNTRPLADSLGIRARTRPGNVIDVGAPVCEPTPRVSFSRVMRIGQLLPVEWRRRPAGPTTTLLHVEEYGGRRQGRVSRSALVGMQLGPGRVVIAVDPDLLRNDQMRICAQGFSFAAVRALEYLRDGGATPRARVSFDEYHQGHGTRVGTVGAIRDFLTGTSPGHVLFQLAIAGVLLLLASAPRLLAPVDRSRVERRSALEHVDALARAYEQVGATRTATARLVRGLRRRTERRATRGSVPDDDTYLERLADLDPSHAPDVALLRRALASGVPRTEFPAVGAAVRNIEAAHAAAARR